MSRCASATGQGRKAVPTKPKTGALTRLPPCPDDMPEAGKKEWKRAGRHLIERGILAETDLPAFTTYCLVTANIAAYMRGAGDKSMGTLPQLATLQRQLANEFGLTPSSRSRIGSEGGGDDDASELDI